MARNTEFTRKIDIEIGHKIYNLRLTKGLSREQFASKIGVSHQQLQKYEKGINRISAGRLIMIAKAFEIDVSMLFDGYQGHTCTIRNNSSIELIREYNSIQDAGIQNAIRLMVRNIARTYH